jgi:hypothetical protein
LLPADLRVELDSFLLSLEAENLPKTRRTYGEAVELLRRLRCRNRPMHLSRASGVGHVSHGRDDRHH